MHRGALGKKVAEYLNVGTGGCQMLHAGLLAEYAISHHPTDKRCSRSECSAERIDKRPCRGTARLGRKLTAVWLCASSADGFLLGYQIKMKALHCLRCLPAVLHKAASDRGSLGCRNNEGFDLMPMRKVGQRV